MIWVKSWEPYRFSTLNLVGNQDGLVGQSTLSFSKYGYWPMNLHSFYRLQAPNAFIVSNLSRCICNRNISFFEYIISQEVMFSWSRINSGVMVVNIRKPTYIESFWYISHASLTLVGAFLAGAFGRGLSRA